MAQRAWAGMSTFGAQCHALWAIWIIINGKWSVTSELGNRCHLGVGVRQAIGQDHGFEINVLQMRGGGESEALVLAMDHRCDIGRICSSVAFGSNVEGELGVFREPVQEQFQKRPNILSGERRVVDGARVARIGEANL